jgi:tetratricopeptide (TPR) repeat protein
MFTAPFILLLLELIVFRESPKAAFKRIWPYLLCLPLIPALIYITAALSDSANAGGALNIVNYNRYSSISYLITQLCVITTYLRMLLLPYGQNIDPDYPLYTSLLQIRPLLSLTLLVSFGAMAGTVFRMRHHDPRSSLVLFGTVWFFLTIAIDSSIVPLPDLMAEQRVYLPAIGFFIVVASLTDLIRTSLSTTLARKMLVMAMVIWGSTLCGVTYARNNVWRSEISVWKDSAEKSPYKARPWNALGIAYATQERYGEAVPCFQRACSIYLGQKKYGEAAEACMKGITLDSANADLYHLLGTAYWQLGQLADAEEVLKQSIAINPGNGSARLVLARVYHAQQVEGAAQEQIRAALQNAGQDPRLEQEIRQFAGELSGVKE